MLFPSPQAQTLPPRSLQLWHCTTVAVDNNQKFILHALPGFKHGTIMSHSPCNSRFCWYLSFIVQITLVPGALLP